MSKHADTKPLAKFHNSWINHSLKTGQALKGTFTPIKESL